MMPQASLLKYCVPFGFLTCGFLIASAAGAGEPERKLLWPDGAPGAKGNKPVDQPAITLYLPNNAETNRAAVVICPGGGYGHLAIGHEGTDIAKWLNGLGIVAVVLEYRMSAGGYKHPIPLQDAQRAIRTVRANAAMLKINPERIGILGFSAGGHLASTAGTHFDKGDPKAKDPIDRMSCRPDFMVLGYPVIAFGEPFTHRGSQENLIGKDAPPQLVKSLSNEKQVTPDTPRTFLFHSDKDTCVPVKNSTVFYEALRKAKVPAELHVYHAGDHGFGLGLNIPGTREWSKECERWMRAEGILGK